MAFSSSSCFFTSPNFPLNQTSTRFHTPRISATATSTLRSSSISTSSSLYEVLGIQIGADTVEVKAAYRKLARVLHPDVRNHDSSPDEFMKVHSAYATLSDPGKRADYDRSLFGRHKMSSSSVGVTGYSGRRWETDQCW
ncbi:chaperone protein dnaJ 11, chloroplastic-like [Cynara cardunculus var. scolymus]|uniref:DnaJ domain-containing protein n=1 Tax=Cynara cardunculus var. scolymus TaxID=59895 RepID=A0A103Y9X7_CYNCS|nr:chaperone protein dnaJ 11, chloroplastic-like [Cynara cardunculus var. scolymus]KVI05216.1 DnaJ domain-containing protein [Cynara cardunculus var. scolymus]